MKDEKEILERMRQMEARMYRLEEQWGNKITHMAVEHRQNGRVLTDLHAALHNWINEYDS